MSLLAKFLHLPFYQRLLILEALCWLGIARFAVIAFPFRWIAAGLGLQNSCSIITPEKMPARQITSIAEAIRRISPYTPWDSNCLAQAIAGRAMLRRRLITSTLYFGVTKDAAGQLEAHAWLRSNGMILTGDAELERYAVVATFTN